jgi:hypothetical protein
MGGNKCNDRVDQARPTLGPVRTLERPRRSRGPGAPVAQAPTVSTRRRESPGRAKDVLGRSGPELPRERMRDCGEARRSMHDPLCRSRERSELRGHDGNGVGGCHEDRPSSGARDYGKKDTDVVANSKQATEILDPQPGPGPRTGSPDEVTYHDAIGANFVFGEPPPEFPRISSACVAAGRNGRSWRLRSRSGGSGQHRKSRRARTDFGGFLEFSEIFWRQPRFSAALAKLHSATLCTLCDLHTRPCRSGRFRLMLDSSARFEATAGTNLHHLDS